MIAVAVLAGVLTWTLLEYLMHRWLGHRFRRNPFGVEHVRHHAEGNYFAPSWKKLIAAVAFAAIAIGPAVALAGWTLGASYVAGLIAFYGAYEWLHRREHTHAGVTRYGRWARRHHFHHHFVDGRVNHGVTSPLWDLVFGTYVRPTIIRVPEKLCMPWLRDASGGIHPAHAGTYQLR